ncbi:MAG: LLM class flavin-dependent oxidoreductase [Acidimicrobiales bacterium]
MSATWSGRGDWADVRPLPPFRFGIQCSSPPDITATSWRALARKVEDLGYFRLTVSDHLDDQLAPVAALTSAADATSTLRVGALVFCNDYRHPAVLAKEAATLDILSEGRFELGMGAGWMTTDYHRAGITMDPPSVRIARLEEALHVVEGLLGRSLPLRRVLRDRRAERVAQPVQRPLPILIGGGGRKVLELAGRHAHIVGLNPKLPNGVIDAAAGPDGTVAATERKIGWILRGWRPLRRDRTAHPHPPRPRHRRSRRHGRGAGAGVRPRPADALASPRAVRERRRDRRRPVGDARAPRHRVDRPEPRRPRLVRPDRRPPRRRDRRRRQTAADSASASSGTSPPCTPTTQPDPPSGADGTSGAYVRDSAYITDRITTDGRDGWPVEPGRFTG